MKTSLLLPKQSKIEKTKKCSQLSHKHEAFHMNLLMWFTGVRVGRPPQDQGVLDKGAARLTISRSRWQQCGCKRQSSAARWRCVNAEEKCHLFFYMRLVISRASFCTTNDSVFLVLWDFYHLVFVLWFSSSNEISKRLK